MRIFKKKLLQWKEIIFLRMIKILNIYSQFTISAVLWKWNWIFFLVNFKVSEYSYRNFNETSLCQFFWMMIAFLSIPIAFVYVNFPFFVYTDIYTIWMTNISYGMLLLILLVHLKIWACSILKITDRWQHLPKRNRNMYKVILITQKIIYTA